MISDVKNRIKMINVAAKTQVKLRNSRSIFEIVKCILIKLFKRGINN